MKEVSLEKIGRCFYAYDQERIYDLLKAHPYLKVVIQFSQYERTFVIDLKGDSHDAFEGWKVPYFGEPTTGYGYIVMLSGKPVAVFASYEGAQEFCKANPECSVSPGEEKIVSSDPSKQYYLITAILYV